MLFSIIFALAIMACGIAGVVIGKERIFQTVACIMAVVGAMSAGFNLAFYIVNKMS